MKPPSDPSVSHPGLDNRALQAAPSDNRDDRRRRRVRTGALVGVATLLVVLLLGAFGGRLLVVRDPLPGRADAAVVLWGSTVGTEARLEGALELLEQGSVDRLMLSVGAVESWGQWLPDMVRDFVRREHGDAVAERVMVCDGLADSTLEETAYLQKCLERAGWRSIVIVTSDFHTRRARSIWSATLARRLPEVEFAMYGVDDGSFAADGWWRRRRYAKTWLLETTKLCWWMVESWSVD